MKKLTNIQITKINEINTHTKKMGLGDMIQELIVENETMKAELKALKTAAKQPIKQSVV